MRGACNLSGAVVQNGGGRIDGGAALGGGRWCNYFTASTRVILFPTKTRRIDSKATPTRRRNPRFMGVVERVGGGCGAMRGVPLLCEAICLNGGSFRFFHNCFCVSPVSR